MADNSVDSRKPDVAGLDIFFSALEKTIMQGARAVGENSLFQAFAFLASMFALIFAFGKPMALGWHYSASMPFIVAALSAVVFRRFLIHESFMSSSDFGWLVGCLGGAAIFTADCTHFPDGDGPVIMIPPGFVFLRGLVGFILVYAAVMVGRVAVNRFRTNYLECRSQALGTIPAEVPAEAPEPVSEASEESGEAFVRHGSHRPLL